MNPRTKSPGKKSQEKTVLLGKAPQEKMFFVNNQLVNSTMYIIY